MSLYENIKHRREELGMTQEELATKLGYKSRSTINKIELGKSDIPQSKIELFAKVLKTTPAELMGWEEDETYNKSEYYLDEETASYAQEIANDSSLYALFSAARNAKKEDLETVINLLNRLKGN